MLTMKTISEYQTELWDLCQQYSKLYNLSTTESMYFRDGIFEGLKFLGGVPGTESYTRQLQKHMVMVHHMKIVVASIQIARKSLIMNSIKE